MNYILQTLFKMTQHGMIRTLNKTSDLVRRFHLSPSRGTYSQTVRAERRIISYSAEVHRRYQKYTHTTGCNAVEKLMITGTWMEIENCQTRGQVSHDSLY